MSLSDSCALDRLLFPLFHLRSSDKTRPHRDGLTIENTWTWLCLCIVCQGVPLHRHKYVTWPVIAADITQTTQINRKYKTRITLLSSDLLCPNCPVLIWKMEDIGNLFIYSYPKKVLKTYSRNSLTDTRTSYINFSVLSYFWEVTDKRNTLHVILY